MSIQRYRERTATAESTDEQDNGCSECGGVLREDKTEIYCTDCGLVDDINDIDHGPEWRAYSFEEGKAKSRVGSPSVSWLHDRGLSTTVGGSGDTVDKKVRKLRKWQIRVNTQNGKERGLKDMMGEVIRMTSELDLPKYIKGGTADLVRLASGEDLVRGRSYESIASAALLITARKDDNPVTLGEVESVTTAEKLQIQRTMKMLQRELDIKIPPLSPEDCIEPFLGNIRGNISQGDDFQSFKNCVINIVQDTIETGIHSSKDPKSIVAGAVYVVARKRDLAGHNITQHDIADAFDLTEVTIRTRYQEIEENRDDF